MSLASIFVTGSIMPWLTITPSSASNLVRALSTAFWASEISPKSPASTRTCSGYLVRSSSSGCSVLAIRTTLWDFFSRNSAIAAPIPATNVSYEVLAAIFVIRTFRSASDDDGLRHFLVMIYLSSYFYSSCLGTTHVCQYVIVHSAIPRGMRELNIGNIFCLYTPSMPNK